MTASLTRWIDDYIAAQTRALQSVAPQSIASAIATVKKVWLAGGQIFCIGNGGGAANASHFATDLGKGASDKVTGDKVTDNNLAAAPGNGRFRVLSLTDNMPWITALGNDYAYEDIFVRQLENYARPNDLLIAVSVSGNSPSCVKAVQWATSNQLDTLAILGGQRGRLAAVAAQAIIVEDTHFGRVEDVQMHVLHMICYAFMEQVA